MARSTPWPRATWRSAAWTCPATTARASRSTCRASAGFRMAPRWSGRCNTIIGDTDLLTLNLHQPDFTTSTRLAETINGLLGAGTAEARDPMSVQVRAPASQADRISLDLHPREPGSHAGNRVGPRDRQFAHGHRRDQLQRPRVAGGGVPRVAGRLDHRGLRREPAPAVQRERRNRGDAPVQPQRQPGRQPDVPVQAGRRAERHRAGRQSGRARHRATSWRSSRRSRKPAPCGRS